MWNFVKDQKAQNVYLAKRHCNLCHLYDYHHRHGHQEQVGSAFGNNFFVPHLQIYVSISTKNEDSYCPL
jgi:hypothetical protein